MQLLTKTNYGVGKTVVGESGDETRSPLLLALVSSNAVLILDTVSKKLKLSLIMALYEEPTQPSFVICTQYRIGASLPTIFPHCILNMCILFSAI